MRIALNPKAEIPIKADELVTTSVNRTTQDEKKEESQKVSIKDKRLARRKAEEEKLKSDGKSKRDAIEQRLALKRELCKREPQVDTKKQDKDVPQKPAVLNKTARVQPQTQSMFKHNFCKRNEQINKDNQVLLERLKKIKSRYKYW